jgi:DNA-directed RNA polymerase subunit omega
MIEALKSDEIIEKVGGKFKLCALIQRRLQQLLDGARPLVDRNGRTDLELVVEEILQDKITLEYVEDQETSEAAEPAASEALL